ncbi:MAG TPA: type II toxin-antitoxin system RelE/ParE family toxin [Phycisphaerales bacterium]|nr:type II toxin-antitoxin system RelE/ParE family toxin [Phycisphaerales bacterium]
MSTAGLSLTKRAVADIVQIGNYVNALEPRAGDAWMNRLWDAFELLADMPEAGHSRPDLSPGLRAWTVGMTLIIYRPLKRGARIIRVLDGRRDVANTWR